MKRFSLAVLCLLILAPVSFSSPNNPVSTRSPSSTVLGKQPAASDIEALSRLPLSFEPNIGQASPEVKFIARGNGYMIFLTETEAIIRMKKPSNAQLNMLEHQNLHNRFSRSALPEFTTIRIGFKKSQNRPRLEGCEPLPGKSNYFIGNDPRNWHTNIPTYARVTYRDLYPGIDLAFYAKAGHLEYDFLIKPGANPANIRLGFESTGPVQLDNAGQLIVDTSFGRVLQSAPVAYQQNGKAQSRVKSRFKLIAKDEVVFQLKHYDRGRALVIDPVFVFSTYLYGIFGGQGHSIATDTAGNSYVAGFTDSPDFPTANALQPTLGGNQDVFVTKLNPAGSAVLFSTFFGGNGADEFARGLAVDSSGNVYITGATDSSDFPLFNALQTAPSRVFVTKLSPTGSALIYSTYLGLGGIDPFAPPADQSQGIAADSSGAAYVVGATSSHNFPVTPGAFQTSFSGAAAGYVTKLNPSGSAMAYSTFLAGSVEELVEGIAVDLSGNAYVTGFTSSPDFPTVNAVQPIYGGLNSDAFATKLDASGSHLLFSTFLGGSSDDEGDAITLDAQGNAYITGFTSSQNFPIGNAFQSTNPGLSAFITKLSAGGNLVYSTFFGGSNANVGTGIAADSAGNVYIAGVTMSPDLPLADAIQTSLGGSNDIFAAKFDPTGSILLFSTYLGGSGDDSGGALAIDSAGSMYIAGATHSTDFPTFNPIQPANPDSGAESAFVTKLTTPVLRTVPVGQTATAATTRTGDAPDLNATFTNNTVGSPSALVIVDKFSANPVAVNVINIGGGFIDLRIIGADPSDVATAQFYYPSTIVETEEAQIQLLYFSGTAWLPVRSSGNADPVKNTTDNLDGTVSGGRFTVIFDNTSTPPITQLIGTLFTPSLTPAGDISFLTSQVGTLPLNNGQKNSLAMKLSAANASLSRGNNSTAAKQIGAFINELKADIGSGKLSLAASQNLIDEANQLLAQLSR